MSSLKPQPQALTLASRIVSGLLWGQALRIVEIGTSLVFLLLVVRRLGPERYGLFALIVNVCSIGVLLSGQGFSETLGKFLPQIRVDDGLASAARAARRILSRNALLVAAFCVLLWLFRIPIGRFLNCSQALSCWPLVLAFFVSQSAYLGMSMVNVGLMKVGLVCAAGSLMNVLALGLAIIGLVVYPASVTIIICASVLAFLVSALVFTLATPELLSRGADKVDMTPMWRFSNRAWLVKLASYAVSGEMMVLLIAWRLGDSREIGYFNAAYMPLRRLQILLLGWTLPVLPTLSELFVTRGAEGVSVAFRLYTKLLIGIVVPVCGFVTLHGDRLITILFSKAFLPAALPLRVYSAVWLIAAMLGSGLTMHVLFSLDRARIAAMIRLGVALVSMLAAYFLVAAFQSLGAMLAAGLALILTAIFDLLAMSKLVQLRLPWAYTAKVLVSSGAALGLSLLFAPKNLFGILCCGVAYVLVYGMLVSRLKPLEMAEKDILLKHPGIAKVIAYL